MQVDSHRPGARYGHRIIDPLPPEEPAFRVYTYSLNFDMKQIIMPGSSIPSAFVLWIMRELPPWIAASAEERVGTITFVHDDSAAVRRPQHWTLTTNSPVCIPFIGTS